MKIKVVPRKYFLEHKNTDEENMIFQNWNIISIITPEYKPTNFQDENIPFSEKYRNNDNVVIVKFHDAEYQRNNQVILMNENDADKIYDFVMKTKDNDKGYLVHCTAGKSRSQAVGYVLNEYFNGKYGVHYNEKEYNEYEDTYKNMRTMNSLVKRLLMNKFFGGII